MIRDLDIGSIPATIPTKEEIVGVTVKDKEVGLKISDTLPCSMLEKMLIELVEVGIGIGPALLPPIIQEIMVYNHFYSYGDNRIGHRSHTSQVSA